MSMIKATWNPYDTLYFIKINLDLKIKFFFIFLYFFYFKTDLLRKKLLLMSKSQQSLVQAFNQELMDQSNTTSQPLTHVYQFQQKTIEIQENEIENLKHSFNRLLAKFNEHEIELDSYKNKLYLKEVTVDELTQTLGMEVVDMKAELIKSHIRIQMSLMNVNKRLEEEILKLKANLNEMTVRNVKLSEQIEFMKSSELELKQLKLNSLFQLESQVSFENDSLNS